MGVKKPQSLNYNRIKTPIYGMQDAFNYLISQNGTNYLLVGFNLQRM